MDEPRKYHRKASFSSGWTLNGVVKIPETLLPKQTMYPWEKYLYELPEHELVKIGSDLAELALGKEGIEKFIDNKRGRTWTGIEFIESRMEPELASVPWELMHIDDEFVALNPKTPISRCLDGYEESIKDIHLRVPTRMLLLSAAPSNLNPLMIEEEQIKFALNMGHFIAKGKLDVHEIVNCTRSKLSTALQYNKYDIIYFTGHGTYINGVGYICLEKEEKGKDKAQFLSSLDFAKIILEENIPSLIFFNCCQSATSGSWYNQLRTFRDMGRELLINGVPDVVGTLTHVFDKDSQIFMRTFFDNLLSRYNVREAVSKARQSLKDKYLNTFYQYIHLSQTIKHPKLSYTKTQMEEKRTGIYFVSLNHPSLDMNLVSRHHPISQIEQSYISGAKAVMVSGIGGVGKTALSQMLENRLLNHYDPKLRVEKTVWLDLREEDSLGSFIRQISNVLTSVGDHFAAIKLKELKDIDVLTVCKILTDAFGDRVLLTLDNCEILLDEHGRPKDQILFRFIVGLVAHTKRWKVLLTTREPFDMTIDGRMLFITHELKLGSLTYTERVALFEILLMSKGDHISIKDEEKENVIAEVAGNPYELILFVRNLTPLSDVNTLIKETHRKTGEYAYLDYYIGKLEKNSLDVLRLLSIFRTPPSYSEVELVAKRLKGFEKINVRRVLEELVDRGLVEMGDKYYFVPTLIAFYLTGR